MAPRRSRARVGEAQGFAPESLATRQHLPAGRVDRHVDGRQRARRAQHGDHAAQPVGVDTGAAGEHDRGLRQTGQQLVHADHGGVGVGRQGVGRQRRREAQVSPPGLVDDERQAGGVRGGGQPRHVGAEAVVARRGDEDGAGPRVLFDRGREALERHVHGHLPGGVEGGLDVDGHGAREDQAGQQRLVGVARHDDLVAGTGDRHDQRLQAAARAVAHKEGVIGAPGERRQRLGARQQTARLLGVVEAVGDAHVGRQQTLAKRVDQVGRRAGAELVAGRVEGRHAPLTVGAQRLDERRLALIGLRHAALAGL